MRERTAADIGELDELIGEILLSRRLAATPDVERGEDLDLLALAAEEGASGAADVAGDAAGARGDARLLRRHVRSLFENARRYGAGSAIEAEVAELAGGVGLAIVRCTAESHGGAATAFEREGGETTIEVTLSAR